MTNENQTELKKIKDEIYEFDEFETNSNETETSQINSKEKHEKLTPSSFCNKRLIPSPFFKKLENKIINFFIEEIKQNNYSKKIEFKNQKIASLFEEIGFNKDVFFTHEFNKEERLKWDQIELLTTEIFDANHGLFRDFQHTLVNLHEEGVLKILFKKNIEEVPLEEKLFIQSVLGYCCSINLRQLITYFDFIDDEIFTEFKREIKSELQTNIKLFSTIENPINIESTIESLNRHINNYKKDSIKNVSLNDYIRKTYEITNIIYEDYSEYSFIHNIFLFVNNIKNLDKNDFNNRDVSNNNGFFNFLDCWSKSTILEILGSEKWIKNNYYNWGEKKWKLIRLIDWIKFNLSKLLKINVRFGDRIIEKLNIFIPDNKNWDNESFINTSNTSSWSVLKWINSASEGEVDFIKTECKEYFSEIESTPLNEKNLDGLDEKKHLIKGYEQTILEKNTELIDNNNLIAEKEANIKKLNISILNLKKEKEVLKNLKKRNKRKEKCQRLQLIQSIAIKMKENIIAEKIAEKESNIEKLNNEVLSLQLVKKDLELKLKEKEIKQVNNNNESEKNTLKIDFNKSSNWIVLSIISTFSLIGLIKLMSCFFKYFFKKTKK